MSLAPRGRCPMGMNIALWIVTGFLAVIYLFSGVLKIAWSKDRIHATNHAAHWVEDFSPGMVKAIGALEVLGAAGLVLPAILDITPVLVPVTAVCLAGMMAGAATVRIRRREPKAMVADLVYLAVCVFVAWGRFGPESFAN